MPKIEQELPDVLLEAYRLVRRVPHGGSTPVYEVVCSRGRLRGRHLAVKKVTSRSRKETSTALHQTLSHPGIVALYLVTPFPDFDYHILEMCSAGNLRDFISSRNPQILSNKEIIQLAKDIGAALTYLRGENIVHRNICKANTLLATGFQAKLCDFEHAVSLERGELTLNDKFTCATHPAPEILRPPYQCGIPVDTWAYGCLILSCLQEFLPTTISTPIDSECRSVLSGYSENFKEFILSLLRADPLERLTTDQILQHPGLNEKTTDDTSTSKTSSRMACYTSFGLSHQPTDRPSSPQTSTFEDKKECHQSVLKNVTNIGLRDYLLKQSIDSGTPKSEALGYSFGENKLPHPTSDSFKSKSRKPAQVRRLTARSLTSNPKNQEPRRPDPIPVGTTRPIPFTTNLLNAATHKLAGGSITIMPSLSTLVDFRESQRRSGFKGDQVLLIDPTGMMISVYSAPHLSTPSCLLEPTQTFEISNLPQIYWKSYNDAASFINTVKRKTPQLTAHVSGGKCILMSNTPLPDMEVILYSTLSSRLEDKNCGKNLPIMRIRYSRQNRSLEISEHTTGIRGPEWKKECMACDDIELIADLKYFSETRRHGINLLFEFLRTCERFDKPNSVPEGDYEVGPNERHRKVSVSEDIINNSVPLSLSSISIPAKPKKYSLKHPSPCIKENEAILVRPPTRPEAETHRPTVPEDDIFPDTRYMPGIGWCVRKPAHPSSPKMKYQLMFADGACLEVDFYHSILRLLPVAGGSVKCLISEKSFHPAIEKRLIHLKDFMLLYDQSDKTSTTFVQ